MLSKKLIFAEPKHLKILVHAQVCCFKSEKNVCVIDVPKNGMNIFKKQHTYNDL